MRRSPVNGVAHLPHVGRYGWLLIACFALTMSAFASGKAHLVIVAIDDSGSMKQSDPLKLRLEAATMLAVSAGTSDQFGAMKFGTGADWLIQPVAYPKQETIAANLNRLASSDKWTNFVAPLQLAEQYLQTRSEFSRNYDINLVLVTDGAPDPGPTYAGGSVQNRSDALDIARRLGQHGIHVYTIGLGSSVQANFLQDLAGQANGFYAPARSAPELRDAFLKVVTRIFSLPAYEQVQGAASSTVHIGRNAGLERAYLFRETSATTIAVAGKPLFAGEHVAAYDIDSVAADIKVQITGPTSGATVILCAQQPLTFEGGHAAPAALLADAIQPIQVQLLGSGEVQWGRLFMRDAAVQLRLHSSGEADVVQPLYPDSATRSYRGEIPTSQPGEYDASVRLESPYGAVDHFLGKFKVAAAAASVPAQATLEYPAFLPTFARRLFGTKVPLHYVLPSGSARISFENTPGLDVSPQQTDIAPGSDQKVTLYPAAMGNSGTMAALFAVTWNNGQQQQIRHGVLTVRLVAQTPLQFATRHWLAIGFVLILATLPFWIVSTPRLKGVLLIEQPQAPRRRVALDALKAKRIVVGESVDRDVLDSAHILVRTGINRPLFSLKMSKTNGQWAPQVDRADGVTLMSPSTLKHGSKITLKDREVTFTYYAG